MSALHGAGARYDDDADDEGWRPRRAERRRRPVLTVVAALVALTAVVLVAVGVHLKDEISPGGHTGRLVEVTVPQGASTADVGRRLASAGVIAGPSLFRWYVSLRHDGGFQAGTYRLATHESYSAVIAALHQGPPVVVDHLVVPEGFTVAQVAARVAALPGFHLSAQTFLADAADGTIRSKYEPTGTNDLEGLLFPATYDVSGTMTEADVLRLMVTKFDAEADALGLGAHAQALGMAPYDLIKVASIVEGEAKLDADRPGVASTIYNRLRAGMTLGADSTLVYALRKADPGLDVAKVDYETPSPYNTRLNRGLPPTPIDDPGLPSLSAAAQPPTTTYLYFVEVDPTGKLGFASTASGFAHLQAQCRAAHLC